MGVIGAGCPGSRGFRDPGEALVRESCWLDKLQLQHAPFVHADQSPLLVRICAEAAPRPILRPLYQTTPHRITMQVAKFLDPFCRRTDVEVIVPRLPNTLGATGAPGAPETSRCTFGTLVCWS